MIVHRFKRLVTWVIAATEHSGNPFDRRRATMPKLEALEGREVPAAGYFRIAEYNIASEGGTPRAGLDAILQAIGAEVVNGVAAPIDVLALQEVLSQSTTTQTVVNQLNAIYGPGAYARGNLDGASTGSGTQGVVYRVSTMQLLSEATIGVASTSGQPRQALRYQFRPVGYSSTADFYLYNSHYKADSDSTSLNRRLVEANAIRADADALGNGVQIVYAGDFNAYSSSEAFYQKLLSAGAGQAFDPIGTPGSWHDTASFVSIFTQAPSASPPPGLTGGGLDDRFDFQIFTSELTDGVGLDYVSGTYHTFGNNGTVAMNGSINAASNTALPGLANRTTVLNLLTTVTDHLPVVADYRIVDSTAPTIVGVYLDGAAWTSGVRAAAGNATYGYPAASGAGQFTPLPWNSVNTIYVKFSEDVAVTAADLDVRGINANSYAVGGFTYDNVNFVAKFTLSTSFDTDRILLDLDGNGAGAVADAAGNKLAGTWVEGAGAFPTAGAAGVDFQYRFIVAVGDVDRNGLVRNADLNATRDKLFVDIGAPGYNVFADLDGNGQTRNADMNAVRNHLFIDPPPGPGPNRASHGARGATVPVRPAAQAFFASNSPTAFDPTPTPRRRMAAAAASLLDELFAGPA